MKRAEQNKEMKLESTMQVEKMNQNKTDRKSKWTHQFKGKCFNCGEPECKESVCPKPKTAYQGKQNKKEYIVFHMWIKSLRESMSDEKR